MGPGVSIVGRLRISVCCNQGGRRYMEDRVCVYHEPGNDKTSSYLFLAVFDGHGGSDASDLVQKCLRTNIVSVPGFESDNDDDVLQAIKDGFQLTQKQIFQQVDSWPKTSSGFPNTSGTTASVVFIRKNKLYVGHVGDSAITIGKRMSDGSIVAQKLTVDHKPDDPEEQRRISERGGEVMIKAGVKRVAWVRPVRQATPRRPAVFEKIPFLAVARALGDVWSYNSSRDEFIVSPTPDVSVVNLEQNHVCLVIGSDGLWNVLSAQNVIDIVNSHEWKELADNLNGEARGDESAPPSMTYRLETNHARWIARHALMRWGKLRADNISVITALFDPPAYFPSHSRSTVLRDEQIFDIEEVLTVQPTAVVHIRAKRLMALRTNPVELFYYGIVETINGSYRCRSHFSGPGYTEFSEASTLLSVDLKRKTEPVAANALTNRDDGEGRDDVHDGQSSNLDEEELLQTSEQCKKARTV